MLTPKTIGSLPEETARVAKTAFPKGNLYITMRDEIGTHSTQDFEALFPKFGQPALEPWRLALVCVMQFIEELSYRQAADAVRSRIDWKYSRFQANRVHLNPKHLLKWLTNPCNRTL